ncbi:type II toxin-antitoxin system HicB family antitoxin [Tautonia sp. JC769]|uniref:type II toxin-antitoxin system HicB family antitoxin n=1 Tax=Tautonia sp. JC769 TaxID=3232135 RepID=UPI003459FCE8
MQITVLVEPIPGIGFRASGGPSIGMEAVGATRDEAIGNLRALIAKKIVAGAELVPLEMEGTDPGENPWNQHAGVFRDDPLFEVWQEAIAEARRDEDPGPKR